MKILVIDDYDGLYSQYWGELGEVTRDTDILNPLKTRDPLELKDTISNSDLVCFTGGDDVSPNLYGHRNLKSINSVQRDRYEVGVFEIAAGLNIPMTGICRGSQFLNVMCGGTMVQHLRKDHGGPHHLITTIEGEEYEVTSSHHQMVVPSDEGQILGWANERLSPGDCIYDGTLPDSVMDPKNPYGVRVTELIAYPERRIVGCQSHPEWQSMREPFTRFMLNLIEEICFKPLEVTA